MRLGLWVSALVRALPAGCGLSRGALAWQRCGRRRGLVRRRGGARAILARLRGRVVFWPLRTWCLLWGLLRRGGALLLGR